MNGTELYEIQFNRLTEQRFVYYIYTQVLTQHSVRTGANYAHWSKQKWQWTRYDEQVV